MLKRCPFCARCGCRLVKSKTISSGGVIHHIVPVADGGALCDERNTMAVCMSCHPVVERMTIDKQHELRIKQCGKIPQGGGG